MIQVIFIKRQPPVGSRPGTLVIHEDSPFPKIRIMQYSADSVQEPGVATVGEISGLLDTGLVTWVDVQGFGDEPTLRALGDLFRVHPLALEDVVNVPQRPKVLAYDGYALLITRMAQVGEDGRLDVEQLGLVVGDRWVLSFQERYGDVLDPVRERIRAGKGPIRASGADYLAYVLLDTIIDAHYPVLENLSNRIERLGDAVMSRPTPRVLEALYRVKSDLLLLRRGIWPQREALNRLVRDPDEVFSADVRVYLRDTYDHAAQLVDVIESLREIINGALNMYLSVVANRTNEVMKVLTIMASIFIPLTFMAGIYGMNFDNMPELQTRWAYPVLLATMIGTAAGMLLYFRRKGWLGSSADEAAEEEDERE